MTGLRVHIECLETLERDRQLARRELGAPGALWLPWLGVLASSVIGSVVVAYLTTFAYFVRR